MDSSSSKSMDSFDAVSQSSDSKRGVEFELSQQHSNNNNNQLSTTSFEGSPRLSSDNNEHMDTRSYDLIIFAASSSVGKFLVEEMALVVDKYYSHQRQRQQRASSPVNGQQSASLSSSRELRDPEQFAQTRRLSVPRHGDDIKWAVAGRSAVKLSDTLCRAELSTGINDLSNQVPVLLADLNHHRSLLEMCSKTRLVLNCAGPYSVDGEAVIKACLETQTNYIDLSHETTFIEQIRRKYSDQAKRAGIYIINGCGFQSMSAEMGLNFTKQVVDGQIDEVKIILNLSDSKALIRPSGSNMHSKPGGIISWGMWCSFLIERAEREMAKRLANNRQLQQQQTIAIVGNKMKNGQDSNFQHHQGQLQRKDTQSLVKDIVEFRNRNSFAWVQLIRGFDECNRKFCLPMNSLTSEESQLIRGEMTNYEHRKPDLNSTEGWRPIRCTSYMSMKSFSQVILILIWLAIFNVIVKFSPLRRLMKAFPSIFSFGHVNKSNRELDRDSLSHIKFCQTFLAYGTPGDYSGDPLVPREKHSKKKQEQLLVARIVGPEPNHVATATYASQAALVLILEKDHLPIGGGVLTPGAAFSETNIIYQLRRRNIKFEVVKKA